MEVAATQEEAAVMAVARPDGPGKGEDAAQDGFRRPRYPTAVLWRRMVGC
jgi:hypothetical protein